MYTFWHLFVYNANKSRDKTQPCGEPVDDEGTLEKAPFTLTLRGLSVKKKSKSQQMRAGLILKVLMSRLAKELLNTVKRLIISTIQMPQNCVKKSAYSILHTSACPGSKLERV